MSTLVPVGNSGWCGGRMRTFGYWTNSSINVFLTGSLASCLRFLKEMSGSLREWRYVLNVALEKSKQNNVNTACRPTQIEITTNERFISKLFAQIRQNS
jgi:chromosome condensin MukBEF complex kleisin-like MukF subunit